MSPRVATSVHEEQKAIWEQEAEEMDMSLSEYVRSMVQAGRRGFNLTTDETATADD